MSIRLSAVTSIRNEEARLAACLEHVAFADQIVVVMDRCTDGSRAIAERFGAKIIEGAWDIEGDRRNAAIQACDGEWILEVDADEHVTEALAAEIRQVIENSGSDWHEILVDNFIGERRVRYGWGASYGKAAYPGLFRKGVKTWGRQRVHPRLKWSGAKGPMLKNRVNHYVDRGVSDMIRRLDNYSSARARDMRETGEIGSTANNVRRLFSRFIKCYIGRKGYREGGYGLLIALFAGLYPIISHIKAKLEDD
ncbi:MAG: glycosyltransferase family 2 protein [Rhodospirillaceae bacterium]|jgi:glycosyltransferase involved in cell wall biosynthesis|nr:glycosyltransferase family 2 protein [Rhodospirillaceae bacterium]MBT3883752.1 glycosyltransferase family 2 protein [Rhodospirillaceae bacterium]MBT4116346.1 glycosyltransferase family 2 protein [Rhodospirillaceae bacterium]MBT4721377.1 glycosyltransferase family 2 protein [Rhodospirillaceae bacterium]MBT4751411.1 glycosyltransferase family 2 protein [Rhodospirillaceae bacterium]